MLQSPAGLPIEGWNYESAPENKILTSLYSHSCNF
jgi:hypothetical protein